VNPIFPDLTRTTAVPDKFMQYADVMYGTLAKHPRQGQVDWSALITPYLKKITDTVMRQAFDRLPRIRTMEVSDSPEIQSIPAGLSLPWGLPPGAGGV